MSTQPISQINIVRTKDDYYKVTLFGQRETDSVHLLTYPQTLTLLLSELFKLVPYKEPGR